MKLPQEERKAALNKDHLNAGNHAKEVIAEYWDLRSKSYAKGVTARKEGERQIWKRCLAPYTCDLDTRKALDLGTGTGFLSLALCDMGIDVTGIDISRGMLTQAKEASCHQKIHLDLCQGDAESLPFQSSSFDLVVSRHLLWTLPDPSRALDEWMSILKPGGRILAIDGNWFDPSPRKKLARTVSSIISNLSPHRNPVPFRKFYKQIENHLPLYENSKPDLYRLLFEEAGLDDVSIDSLSEVNRFYSRNTNFPYRLANADTVFLVKGDKAGSP